MLGNLFIGTFIILFGISVIFGVSLIRPLFGLFLIYIGICYVIGARPFGPTKFQDTRQVVFGKHHFKDGHHDEKYSVVFGQAIIDWSEIDLTNQPTIVYVKSVFASTVIKIDPAIATKIRIKTVGSSVQLPDDSIVTMGNHTYKTKQVEHYDLVIKVKSVFSHVIIKNK